MAFGTKQWNNPTPASANNSVGAISAIGGVLIAYLQTANYIPGNIVDIVTGIIGLVIALSQAVRPFFGVHIESEVVPTDQVTAIDTTK